MRFRSWRHKVVAFVKSATFLSFLKANVLQLKRLRMLHLYIFEIMCFEEKSMYSKSMKNNLYLHLNYCVRFYYITCLKLVLIIKNVKGSKEGGISHHAMKFLAAKSLQNTRILISLTLEAIFGILFIFNKQAARLLSFNSNIGESKKLETISRSIFVQLL